MYDDESMHCFVAGCGYTVVSDEYKEENSQKKKPKIRKEPMEQTEKVTKEKEAISEEKAADIKKETSTRCNGYRSLTDSITAYFGVRHSFSEEDGTVLEQYYPCTQEGKLVGYKVREVPKDFKSIGRTGATTECFMQFRFTRGGKYVILTEGEIDALSAYQMLKEYNDKRGADFEIAVVSATTGANSSKQLAHNYKFFDSFDNIVVSYDNDAAGQKAVEQIVKVLPKGKVKIMQMKHKDANEYLQKGDQKAFIADFYNAKSYVPTGVLGSDGLYASIIEQAHLEKVPLPPFLKTLEKMIGGGLVLGHIYNIAAMTSIGKTALVNEIIYHWIFNSPHKIGVVSMELNSGQYGETLLSRHMQKKLALVDQAEKIRILESDYAKAKAKELFETQEGVPRFYLVEDRDGSVEQIQDTIEQMVISAGVKIIVIDVLQDLIEGMSNEDQALFMKWCKSIIKSHNISFVLINHTRKKGSTDSEDIKISESDVMGSSVITKSASVNILLARNKNAEDDIERNTTYVSCPKSRLTGLTGPAGKIYYENSTHTMYDFDEWMQENGPKDF